MQESHSEGAPDNLGRGWHSRGYLPHYERAFLIQSVTFHLADSLPAVVLARMSEGLRFFKDEELNDERRKRIDAALDAGHGECILKHPEFAKIVEDALLYFNGTRYRMIAWCVMPNHVHALFETLPGHALGRVIKSWKSHTANKINLALHRSGSLWYPDYFDRFIRDGRHFDNALNYIEANPVKAGLVIKAEDWKFSSARLRKDKDSH